MQPHSVRPVDPDTGQPFPPVPLGVVHPNIIAGPPPSQFFENQCYRGVETHAFTTGGTLPAAYYTGNRYGGPITGGPGHYPPCGYEPAAMQIAYGLSPLITAGNDGTGQTVVIVDAWGSPTAAADFGVFSSTFGLPTGGFADHNPFGAAPTNYELGGRDHARHRMVALHGAGRQHCAGSGPSTIMTTTSRTRSNMHWIISLGNQISNSYGSDEYDE